jgi:MFS family permease
MAEEVQRNPFAEAKSSKKFMILVAIFIGVSINIMISTTNSTVLVATANDIGGMDIYPFVSSIPGILGICIMPVYGFLSSKFPANRRTILIVSYIVGTITLLIRGVAPNMPFLIAGNFFWGMVSAGSFVVGYTMIRDMYDQKKTGIYLGLVGTAMSLAKLIGPIFAGFLIDNIAGGWRIYTLILAACFLLATLLIIGGVKVKKEEVAHLARGSAKLDVAGCITVILCLGGLITVLSLPAQIPPGSPIFFGLLALALVSLIALILVIRKKQDNALIPISVVKDKNTVLLSLMNFFGQMSTAGILFFIPAYVMRILVADPMVETLGAALAGGLVTTLIGVSGAILSPIFGRMIAKSGSVRTVLFIGTATRVIVIGGFLLILTPNCPVWIIWALMFIAGGYNAQSLVAAPAGAQIQIKQSLRAMSNSLIQLGQNLGAGLVIAVFTFFTGAFGFEGGLTVGLWTSFAFTVLFFIVSVPMKPLSEEEKLE